MQKTIDGKTLEMLPIDSRNLSNIGYIEETCDLAVEFKRGALYLYKEVPKNIFDELLSSPDPDACFDEKIKNTFKNRRVI